MNEFNAKAAILVFENLHLLSTGVESLERASRGEVNGISQYAIFFFIVTRISVCLYFVSPNNCTDLQTTNSIALRMNNRTKSIYNWHY